MLGNWALILLEFIDGSVQLSRYNDGMHTSRQIDCQSPGQ